MEAAVLSLLQHKDAAGLPNGVYRPEKLARLTEAEKAELARQVLETQAFWPGAEEGRRTETGTVLPACLIPPHCPSEYEWIQFPADPGVQNPLGFYILVMAAQQPAHLSRHGIRYGG